MKNPRLRSLLALAILIATVILFVRFFQAHPQYWQMLKTVSPWTIVWVVVLNGLMVGILVLINAACLGLCGKRIGWHENFLLTAYSSIANFFGPLQSGPGVRAVYLKAKHQVRLRDFTLATLINLGLFACFSALALLVGMRPWWQTLAALLAVAAASWLVLRLFVKRDKQPSDSTFALRGNFLAALVVLAFLQVAITVAWYYVELHAVDASVSFSQAMSYAGAANFALFVSITPDAIGIREAFLVFSQHVHHVSTPDIVAANVIDRAAYALFLVLLFIVTLSLHAKDRLQLTKLRRQADATSQR
jgi:uncharacterized membrane protein YbhN (UPF0104 family)